MLPFAIGLGLLSVADGFRVNAVHHARPRADVAPALRMGMGVDMDDLADGGAVACFVKEQLSAWSEAKVPDGAIHVKDFSAAGGARVYKVWQDDEATKPAAVILKAAGDTGGEEEEE